MITIPKIDYVEILKKHKCCSSVASEAAYIQAEGTPAQSGPTWIYDEDAECLKYWKPSEGKFVAVKLPQFTFGGER